MTDQYILEICRKLTAARVRIPQGDITKDEVAATTFTPYMPMIEVLRYLPENKLQAMCEADYTSYNHFYEVTKFWSQSGYLLSEPYRLPTIIPIYYIHNKRYVQLLHGNFVVSEDKEGNGMINTTSFSTGALAYLALKYSSYLSRVKLCMVWIFAGLVDSCCRYSEMSYILHNSPVELFEFCCDCLRRLHLKPQYTFDDLTDIVSCKPGTIPDYRNIYRVMNQYKNTVFVAYGHDSVQIEYKLTDCPSYVFEIKVPSMDECKGVRIHSNDYAQFKYRFHNSVRYEDILRLILVAALRYVGVQLDYCECSFSERLSRSSYRSVQTTGVIQRLEDISKTYPNMY